MRWPVHDGFRNGVNLPWLDDGGDCGSNRWRPSGGAGRPDRRAELRQVLGRLAGHGIPTVRRFMFADGRAGLQESQDDDVVGLDDRVFRDADAAVEELGRVGLTAVFVLFDYHWFRRTRVVDAVRTGGRGAQAAGWSSAGLAL